MALKIQSLKNRFLRLQEHRVVRIGIDIDKRATDDSLPLVSSGVAFHIFLSIFPALATAFSIYGLLASQVNIDQQMTAFREILPPDVLEILAERAKSLVANQDSTLTMGLVFGTLISLWSANRAMKAIAEALNIAYDTREDRTLLKKNAITLVLTLLSTLVFIFVVSIVVILPVFVTSYLSGSPAALLTTLVSWAIFISVLWALFMVLYAFAPAQRRRPWKSLMPGAITSALLVVVASTGFSLYVANFGQYDEQYGALGAVVVTMLWLFIGSFIFLLGAEINAVLFKQSRKTLIESE